MARMIVIGALASAALTVAAAAGAQETETLPSLPGPAPAPAAPAKGADENVVVARVGTVEITLTDIVAEIYSLPEAERQRRPFDELYKEILDHRIDGAIVYQAALASGVKDDVRVQKRLAEIERQVTADAFLENIINARVTPKALSERYDAYVAAQEGRSEYRARHIYAKSQEEIDALAARLAAGEDFEQVALSLDYPGADRGGDLGFFDETTMRPEVVDAARALSPGEVSPPFQTNLGWHLIRLEAVRPARARPVAEMQEQLYREMSDEVVKNVLAELRANVPVERFNRDGTPAEAAPQ